MNIFVRIAAALLIGMSAVVGSCFSSASTAAALPARDIPEMVASADLIVLGEVKQADVVGPNDEAGSPLSPLDIVISIRKVLSGSLSSGTTDLTVRVSGSQRHYLVNVYPGQVGVVFLKRAGGGTYRLSDPYYLFVVAREPRHRLVAGTNPLSAIADDLIEVLRRPDSVEPKESRTLNRATLVSPSNNEASPVESGLSDAADALETIPSGITQYALERVAADEHTPLLGKLWAIIVLLAQNDTTFIDTVVDVLNRHPSDVGGFTLSTLASQLEDVDLDNKSQGERDHAAKAVLPLLDSKDKYLRESAVGLLRSSRSKLAVRPLLRALSDEDLETRYMAVFSLCMIVPGQENAPSYDLFRHNEEYYVHFWQHWGQQ